MEKIDFEVSDLTNEQKASLSMHNDAIILREKEIESFNARSKAIATAAVCLAAGAASLFIYTITNLITHVF